MTYKILLIEDDITMIKLLQTYLQFEGFQVIIPGKDDTLEQMMESIRQEKPVIVLLDVYMQKFNGFDLLNAIRQDKETREVGVIVSSGSDFGERCLEEGADYFILKPFMPEELIKSIRKVIAKRATPK
jgi:DNA-binding response OmpR family regulator